MSTTQSQNPRNPGPASNAPRPAVASAVAQLMRPGALPRTPDVGAAARQHAATVVAHLMHQECPQWSWAEHHPDTHLPQARRIVGALCREGWAPRSDDAADRTGAA